MDWFNYKFKGKNLALIILFAFACLAPLASGAQVVVNSQDWKDVYSGMIYAKLNSDSGNYIINEGHGLLLQQQLNSRQDIVIIESVQMPFIRNYGANLEAKGFTTEIIYAEENLNMQLLESIDAEGYIIIDSRYSYNAISVAPYAVKKRYFVVFADSDNIGDIIQILENKGKKEIIIYGFVDREVTEELSGYSPLIINKGEKYENNLELLKIFIEEFSPKQLILADGTLIEPQFFEGNHPVLFIGRSNIPDNTLAFLKKSDIKHALLIGYDIFDNAVSLKDKAGLKIIVKFAKGVDSRQYALDIFEIPQARYDLGISSAEYNTLNSQLEVSFFNTGEAPAFIRSSHTVLRENRSVVVVGDDDTFFLNNDETVTIAYDAQIQDAQDLVLRSNMLYGEDKGSLEFLLIAENPIDIITYEDLSDIMIKDAYFNTQTRRIIIEIENIGDVDVYAKPSVIGIIVNNRQQTLTGEALIIPEGRSETFKIKAPLTPEDIEDNKMITVGARFGKRQSSMIHYMEDSFEFRAKALSGTIIIAGAAALILIAAGIIIFVLLKKRKKQYHKHKDTLKKAPPARK